MKYTNLRDDFEFKYYLNLANLHQSILTGSIASTLSSKDLAKLYKILIRNNIMEVTVVEDNDNLVGSISCTISSIFKIKKNIDFIKILIIFSFGFFRHPIIWVTESFYKLISYYKVSSKINIVFLFVDNTQRGKNIGRNLIQSVIKKHNNSISVDTRTDNHNAIKFYKNNSFKVVRSNKKNTVLIYE